MNWNLQEAITYYKSQGAPGDQGALISLLREIQAENGGSIPRAAVAEVAAAYTVGEALLLALIRRIPSLRLRDTHTLELCAGPNCGKHTALAAAAEELQKGGNFELKYVPCMRQCGRGPNVRWDGKLYHQVTEAILKELVKK